MPTRKQPKPKKTAAKLLLGEPASIRRPPNTVYTLRVNLIGGPVTQAFAKRNPVISRTIEIRGDQTLAALHLALFDAFKREEEHLYEFQVGGKGPHDPEAIRYGITRGDGMKYMMNFQVESMSPTVYSKTHHEIARLGARRGLYVPFPMWMSRSLTPFTYIDYDAKPNELHVFTFHAFPEDLTIVKTQSIFELA